MLYGWQASNRFIVEDDETFVGKTRDADGCVEKQKFSTSQGYSLKLQASDVSDRIVYPNLGDVTTVGNTWTMELWFKINRFPSDIGESVSLWHPRDVQDITVYISPDNRIQLYFYPHAPHFRDGETISDHNWHHVAVVSRADQTFNLYLDGKLNISNFYTPAPPYRSGENQLGNHKNSGTYQNQFDGLMDEFRIWDEKRSQQQLQTHMNRRLTGKEPNLQLYYPMDEGEGTTAVDQAGSNDGTIYGATYNTNTPF